MSSATATALTVSLASLLFDSGIGALIPGEADAELETPTQVSVISTAPAMLTDGGEPLWSLP